MTIAVLFAECFAYDLLQYSEVHEAECVEARTVHMFQTVESATLISTSESSLLRG